MRVYLKPVIECIEIRPEERLAVGSCVGSCNEKVPVEVLQPWVGNTHPDA